MKCKLIHGDCVKVMSNLIDNGIKVDLTVTSPPYDNLRNYDNKVKWDSSIFKQIANKLYQITKDGGVVVWVVNDATIKGSETGTSFKQALYFKKIGFNLHDTMIYQKAMCPYPERTRYYPSFEYMFVLSKGKPKTVNLIRDRKNKTWGKTITNTNRQKDGSLEKSNGAKLKRKTKEYGVRFNIWTYNTGINNSSKNPIAFKHPAIFPEKLALDHIKSWSDVGDLVFDPMMGSGTTGVACLELKRNFIGIEKVKEYYDIAKERCNEYQEELM